ncbi:MAG: glycosyltransferase family 4 protein, partial [Phycisphaerales bacterium]|nr:glycosyltransferase family 4 protein [Phycisphaerales bacterium]
MKVCLFADAQSVHTRQLVRALVSRGITVHVVTHKPADLPGASVEPFSVPPPGVTNLRRWDGRLRNYLRGFLRRFDVVNIHFLADWGFGEWVVEERASRAAVVATAWGSDIVDPPGETAATPEQVHARVQVLRAADAVTVCGPTFARTVARYAGIPPESVDVVPFGVDLDLFTRGCPAACGGVRTDRFARAAGGALRIGFFKGFRAVYGPICLIRAIPQVVAQVPGARFELIGDGAELPACQALARQLGVEPSIEWIPRQDHARLPAYLSRWDVSVIPSVYEAFGVAALESSAMQVPVIASDVCGLRDTVRDGETGLLVPPDDPPRLAEAIVCLL